MKRSVNKRKSPHRCSPRKGIPPKLWKELERFHALGLRMAGFLHQLKTPLNVIRVQAELLAETPALSADAKTSLDLILRNVDRAAQQMKDILRWARQGEVLSETVSISQLAEDICREIEPQCRKKGITLERHLDAQSPVQAEPLVLAGALHNLVDNAIEAMPNGGTLKVGTFSEPEKKRVGMQIEDTGAGMSAAALAALRKPFGTTKANGNGLGVFITRHILKRHHASMQWQSQPGQGTSVRIAFPLMVSLLFIGGARPSRAALENAQVMRIQGHFPNMDHRMTDSLLVHFSVWDNESGWGRKLWEETQTVDVRDSAFQVVLGRVNPLPSNLLAEGDRWLEMQIGDNPPLRPRRRIPGANPPPPQAPLSAPVVYTPPPPTYVPPAVPPPAPAPSPVAVAAPMPEEEKSLEVQIDSYNRDAKPKKRRVAVHEAAPAPSAPSATTYVVRQGDTLRSIAKRLYGNAGAWYDLYYLNKDRLGPLGYVSPGQTLVLPDHVPEPRPGQ